MILNGRRGAFGWLDLAALRECEWENVPPKRELRFDEELREREIVRTILRAWQRIQQRDWVRFRIVEREAAVFSVD